MNKCKERFQIWYETTDWERTIKVWMFAAVFFGSLYMVAEKILEKIN